MRPELPIKQDIISALEALRDECNKHAGTCHKCCLGYIDGGCALMAAAPGDWEINRDPPDIWRALK